MGIPKNVTIVEEIDDDLQSGAEHLQAKSKKWQSKRGAKPASSEKPKGAVRVLTDSRITTNRPKLVYKERVVDSETGDASWRIWILTEQSKYNGIEELVTYNPRTEQETHKGFDYTIPFTVEAAKKIIAESFGETKFYIKDGVPTYMIKQEDLNELFLKDFMPGITPIKGK